MKPHAALIRENEHLRAVASAAIRLRRVGQLSDRLEEAMKELFAENPSMSRSGTMAYMYAQAFDTAMKAFDDAVLAAALVGMDWAQDHKIEVVPVPGRRDK